jgi:hypothetical protein
MGSRPGCLWSPITSGITVNGDVGTVVNTTIAAGIFHRRKP